MRIVFPNLVLNNQEHQARINVEHFCNPIAAKLSGDIKCSDFSDLWPRQFGKIILFSCANWWGNRHAFISRILIIIVPRSKEQVVRVNTCPVVTSGAVVAHTHSFWNRTPKQNPRCAVGKDSASVFTANANASIAVNQGRYPNPAPNGATGEINLSHEPFGKGQGKTLRSEIIGISIWLHNQFVWLCHALGCSFTARAFLL